MPKILITNSYTEPVKAIIESLKPNGFELVYLNDSSKTALLEVCPNVEYFLVGGRLPIDKDVIDAAIRLKMIQRTGVGLDQMDLKYLEASGIPIYVNKGVNANAVAEHTLMLILATLRKLNIADSLLKSGVWQKQGLGVKTFELRGKTIGMVGLGKIGEIVAKLLKPFGVDVLYNKRNRLSKEEEINLGIRFVDLEALFQQSDIVSLHCAFNESTKEIINKESIQIMKDGVFIINTSRGKLIREDDLISALQSGKIAAAGLDVFYDEPILKDNPLLKLNNVVLTPHISGITKESFSKMFTMAFLNIVNFEDGNLDKIQHCKV